MRRIAMDKLEAWKLSPHRKPLIIRGVRQVGKTWLMTQFAQKHFEGHYHYLSSDNRMDPQIDIKMTLL